MTFPEFKLLSEDDQIKIIGKHGVKVADREEEEISFLLYQLDGFYIECIYDGSRLMPRLKSFCDTLQLEPYLKEIDISKLINK